MHNFQDTDFKCNPFFIPLDDKFGVRSLLRFLFLMNKIFPDKSASTFINYEALSANARESVTVFFGLIWKDGS